MQIMKTKILIPVFLFTVSWAHSQDLSALYEKVSGSVVLIKTTEKELVTSGSQRQMIAAEGLGSGVLIDATGRILTASHVVHTAEDLKVILKDGEEIPAKILATEPTADVALIKTLWPPTKMPQLPKVTNSDDVKIGERIIIIGAPYGLTQSLSSGFISGRHKKDNLSHNLTTMEFFQTDAAINQGNSGGPMFNMQGEVVGIVSYILTESGGFQGLGFAATSNMASRLLTEKKGLWFGLDAVFLPESVAGIFNVPQKGGFLVQKVVELSPSHMIGMQGGTEKITIGGRELIVGGDIVLEIAGVILDNQEKLLDLRKSVAEMQTGDQLKVKVLRKGEIHELTYNLPER
jgi:serine protease Do